MPDAFAPRRPTRPAANHVAPTGGSRGVRRDNFGRPYISDRQWDDIAAPPQQPAAAFDQPLVGPGLVGDPNVPFDERMDLAEQSGLLDTLRWRDRMRRQREQRRLGQATEPVGAPATAQPRQGGGAGIHPDLGAMLGDELQGPQGHAPQPRYGGEAQRLDMQNADRNRGIATGPMLGDNMQTTEYGMDFFTPSQGQFGGMSVGQDADGKPFFFRPGRSQAETDLRLAAQDQRQREARPSGRLPGGGRIVPMEGGGNVVIGGPPTAQPRIPPAALAAPPAAAPAAAPAAQAAAQPRIPLQTEPGHRPWGGAFGGGVGPGAEGRMELIETTLGPQGSAATSGPTGAPNSPYSVPPMSREDVERMVHESRGRTGYHAVEKDPRFQEHLDRVDASRQPSPQRLANAAREEAQRNRRMNGPSAEELFGLQNPQEFAQLQQAQMQTAAQERMATEEARGRKRAMDIAALEFVPPGARQEALLDSIFGSPQASGLAAGTPVAPNFAPEEAASLEGMKGYKNQVIKFGHAQGWPQWKIDKAVAEFGGSKDRSLGQWWYDLFTPNQHAGRYNPEVDDVRAGLRPAAPRARAAAPAAGWEIYGP